MLRFLHRHFKYERLAVTFCLATSVSLPANAQPPEPPPAERTAQQQSDSSALLRELQNDYENLAKKSPHQDKLRQAERLLRELDDQSKWSNYSAAVKILRQYRDRAAIPLLLRYSVLHAERSSAHIIVPEYHRTIVEISGHAIAKLYNTGPDRVESTRQAVDKVTESWWREFRDTLPVSAKTMDQSQLEIVAEQLLDRVGKSVDFGGSGGTVGTAYHTLHVMYYRMNNQRSEGFPFDRDPRLVSIILEKIGHQNDKKNNHLENANFTPFPFDAAWILGEFTDDNSTNIFHKVVSDQSQGDVVRTACVLALMRMGRSVDIAHVLSMLEDDDDRQRQMIYLLMLRWFGGDTTQKLLDWMQHADIEIATAAACALRDVKPDQAIDLFSQLMDRPATESPGLLLGELADYEQQTARDLMERLLRQSLEGKKHAEHLSRIVDACADSWGIDRDRYRSGSGHDAKVYGHRVLELIAEVRKLQAQKKRTLELLIDSLNTQVQVAQQIETLRRAEYKRLLSLQGDDVVDSKDSQLAGERLEESSKEVAELKQKLLNSKSILETFDNCRPKVEVQPTTSLFGD